MPRDDRLDAGEGRRFARVDTDDTRVGVGAAQYFPHQHAWQGDIGAKLRSPGDFIEGIDFRCPASNDTECPGLSVHTFLLTTPGRLLAASPGFQHALEHFTLLWRQLLHPPVDGLLLLRR